MEYNVTSNCLGTGLFGFSDVGTTGSSQNIIRFNLSLNDARGGTGGGGGLHLSGAGAYDIYNNTVISSLITHPALVIDSGLSVGKRIWNNIFWTGYELQAFQLTGTFDATCKLDYNSYQSGSGSAQWQSNGTTYSSLASWQAANGGRDTHSIAGSSSKSELQLPYPLPVVGANNFLANSPPTTPPNIAGLCTAWSPLIGSGLASAGADLSTLFSVNPGSRDLLGNAIPVPYSIGAINAPVSAADSYHAAVVADSPLVWLQLNEPAGGMYDSALSFGPGSYTSCTQGVTSIIPAAMQPCVNFPTSGTSCASVTAVQAGTGYTGMTSLTAEGWYLPTGTSTMNFFNCYDAVNIYQPFNINVSSVVSVIINDGTNAMTVTSTGPTALSASVVNYVAIVWSTSIGGGATANIYINGVQQTVSVSGSTPSTTKVIALYLGSHNGNANPVFAGKMQQIAVYGTALSGTRIAAHYAAGIASFFPYYLGDQIQEALG